MDHRCINYLFIGTVPILLFIWHGWAGGRIFARPARFFLAVLVFAMLFAVGRDTPLFGWAFDWLPGVSPIYRRPADATFVVNIMLALTSGYLLHRYIEDGLPSLPLLRPRWLAYVLRSRPAHVPRFYSVLALPSHSRKNIHWHRFASLRSAQP